MRLHRRSANYREIYPRVWTRGSLVLGNGGLFGGYSVAAEYAAPQITAITEGIVKGTEQRLPRALFKVAVELGAVSHMLAAVHEIDDDTMIKLRTMCTDEVKRINGIINFEKAVRYQRSD